MLKCRNLELTSNILWTPDKKLTQTKHPRSAVAVAPAGVQMAEVFQPRQGQLVLAKPTMLPCHSLPLAAHSPCLCLDSYLHLEGSLSFLLSWPLKVDHLSFPPPISDKVSSPRQDSLANPRRERCSSARKSRRRSS